MENISSSISNSVPEENDVSKNAAKEFKIIIMIILCILIAFMCAFVYNIIKCYLPKWRNKRQLVEESDNSDTGHNTRKLEMYDA
jgi:hypothetical protein